MVVPERHDEDVAASKRRAHAVQAAELGEGVVVAEGSLLGLAEVVGQGVTGDARDGGVGVLVHLAVLHVEALDLAEAGAGADELGNDGHLLLGVELLAGAVEVLDAHAVAVEVTAVLVADALVAVIAVTTVSASAGCDTRTLAGVGGICGGDGVGLPDIHLSAAGASVTLTSVGVVLGAVPALDVGLAVDPLDVVGALSVTVSYEVSAAEVMDELVKLTSSVLGTGLVVALVDATVGSHLSEVESTVQTARKVRNINIEGELLVDEIEHLVLGVGLHEVSTGSDVAGVLALGNELQGQSIVGGSDTIGACRRSENAPIQHELL